MSIRRFHGILKNLKKIKKAENWKCRSQKWQKMKNAEFQKRGQKIRVFDFLPF